MDIKEIKRIIIKQGEESRKERIRWLTKSVDELDNTSFPKELILEVRQYINRLINNK